MFPHTLFKYNRKLIRNITNQGNLLNLPYHKIDHDFTYILWYSLLTWRMNKKKIKMFKMKMIMIMMSIMKLSQLIKTHQINNISYTILGLITYKELLILIFYVHMNFLVIQKKSTTSVVIYLIVNTLNTTPTTLQIQNTKKSNFTNLHNTFTNL